MKDFVKKHLITIVCLVFVVVGGIIAAIVVPNLNDDKLQVSIKSLTATVGEKTEVEYSANKDAVLTFSIDDEDIAVVEETTGKVYVLGVKAGTTKIKVVAQLGDLYCSASARVVVVASEVDTPATPVDPDLPTDEGDGEQSGDGGETPTPNPEPEAPLTMTISFPDKINCEEVGEALICSTSKTATISISVSVDATSISVTSNNPSMNVVKNDLAGRTVYKLSATEAGTYKLVVEATAADDKVYTCNYNVIFQ